jgi:hypothetical protein
MLKSGDFNAIQLKEGKLILNTQVVFLQVQGDETIENNFGLGQQHGERNQQEFIAEYAQIGDGESIGEEEMITRPIEREILEDVQTDESSHSNLFSLATFSELLHIENIDQETMHKLEIVPEYFLSLYNGSNFMDIIHHVASNATLIWLFGPQQELANQYSNDIYNL